MNRKKLINGSNHQATKIINRSLVLKMICTGTNLSRIDIARQTGLSKMSISNIVNALISEGFVAEKSGHPGLQSGGSSGRKPVFLTADKSHYTALGIYISRDYAVATLANLMCENITEAKCCFSREETEKSFVDKIIRLTSSVLDSSGALEKKIIGIGIACIGPLDMENGIILEPPNFHKLRGIPIKTLLEKQFGYEVFVKNDMNASALAEKLYGKGKNTRNFVYVGVTNGIGSGIIANNSLFEGDMGFGGEIGHTTINFEGPKCACGNTGCLELYASIPEIVKQAGKALSEGTESSMKGLINIEWDDIVRHAVTGDKLALNLIDRLCGYISFGLASLVNIFDPQTIYLGHEIALAGSLAAKRLESYLRERIFSSNYKSVPVEISAFNDKAPVAGSAAIILDKLFSGHNFKANYT